LNQKVDGLIVTKWDKQAGNTAVLYFSENVRIHSVDGKENVNMYGQAVPIRGSGTEKKPKARLSIPSGERKLVISYLDTYHHMTEWEKQREVAYIFVSGRYYQLSASANEDISYGQGEINMDLNDIAAKGGVGNFLSAVKEATPDAGYAMNLEITDITGGKKKNSPSIIITVK
jgi:hypothetical protein